MTITGYRLEPVVNQLVDCNVEPVWNLRSFGTNRFHGIPCRNGAMVWVGLSGRGPETEFYFISSGDRERMINYWKNCLKYNLVLQDVKDNTHLHGPDLFIITNINTFILVY